MALVTTGRPTYNDGELVHNFLGGIEKKFKCFFKMLTSKYSSVGDG
jgi:hypothetical protein